MSDFKINAVDVDNKRTLLCTRQVFATSQETVSIACQIGNDKFTLDFRQGLDTNTTDSYIKRELAGETRLAVILENIKNNISVTSNPMPFYNDDRNGVVYSFQCSVQTSKQEADEKSFWLYTIAFYAEEAHDGKR